MRVLFYSPGNGEAAERIHEMAGTSVPSSAMEVCKTFDGLSRRLRQPRSGLLIVVLCIADRDDLLSILSIQSLLRDLRIILVLPDRENDTLVRGLGIRPRFFTFADADYTEVIAVLSKMLHVYGSEAMVAGENVCRER